MCELCLALIQHFTVPLVHAYRVARLLAYHFLTSKMLNCIFNTDAVANGEIMS